MGTGGAEPVIGRLDLLDRGAHGQTVISGPKPGQLFVKLGIIREKKVFLNIFR
jgi:hypothetical protein